MIDSIYLLKGTTGKELWSGEGNGVPEGDREVWGNLKAASYSQSLLTLTLGKLTN